MLRVVSGIRENPVEGYEPCSFPHRGTKLGRILRGPEADVGGGEKVALAFAGQGYLGPVPPPKASFALAPDEIPAHVAAL